MWLRHAAGADRRAGAALPRAGAAGATGWRAGCGTAQDEREQLLVGSLAASDRERTRIAADLHDGVVQGLAGASLHAVARQPAGAATTGPATAAEDVGRTALDLRRWVRELRSLVVTITPPALHPQGLARACERPGRDARGARHRRDRRRRPGARSACDEATEALVYRVAQEAVRNIVRHADASHVPP